MNYKVIINTIDTLISIGLDEIDEIDDNDYIRHAEWFDNGGSRKRKNTKRKNTKRKSKIKKFRTQKKNVKKISFF